MKVSKPTLLLLFTFYLLKAEAQTVGVYGGTFHSGWLGYGINQNYTLGRSGGIFINSFLKGSFNPGLDLQFSENTHDLWAHRIYMSGYPYFSDNDTFHFTNITSYRSIADIKLNLEYTSPQEDTLVVAFGLQPGLAYLTDYLEFTNRNLPNIYLTGWVPSLGGCLTIRRNYVFGMPFQLFMNLSVQSYLNKKAGSKIDVPFHGTNPITIGYVKLGLAYRFN